MRITYQMLMDRGACEQERITFIKLFGRGNEGVEVTVEAAKAVASEFDWEWAVEYLIGWKEYTYWLNRVKRASVDIREEIYNLHCRGGEQLTEDEYKEVRIQRLELYSDLKRIRAKVFAELWIEKYGK